MADFTLGISDPDAELAAELISGVEQELFFSFDGAFEQTDSTIGSFQDELFSFFGDDIFEASKFSRELIGDISNSIDEGTSAIEDELRAIIERLQAEADKASEVGSGLIGKVEEEAEAIVITKLVPVFETLFGIAEGTMTFADFDLAVAALIQASVQDSLALIQALKLNEIRDGIGALTANALDIGRSQIEAARTIGEELLKGVIGAINKALEAVATLILDPLARLLQAILDAIKGLPTLFVLSLIDELLRDPDVPLASS